MKVDPSLCLLSCLIMFIYAILEGLVLDYAAVVSVIESKFETPPIIEVEALSFRGLNLYIKLWFVYSKPSMVLNRLRNNGLTHFEPPFWSLAFLLRKSILLSLFIIMPLVLFTYWFMLMISSLKTTLFLLFTLLISLHSNLSLKQLGIEINYLSDQSLVLAQRKYLRSFA